MSESINIGNCPECGHYPSQLVGDDSALHYVIHLPDKSNCQSGPHNRIHELESQLEQEKARRREIDNEAFKYADQLQRLQLQNERLTEKLKEKMIFTEGAWVLRKQAEAVEEFGDHTSRVTGNRGYQLRARGHAKNLRQQADELEAANAGGIDD